MAELPVSAGAGLSFAATVTSGAHPAPAWSVSLHLRGAGVIDLAAQANGERHVFKAAPTVTAAWSPGRYWWAVRATSEAGDVVEIETGTLEVRPDMTAATEFDGLSENEKAIEAIEAIEAVMAKRATVDQERYRINNRELYRTPIADLMKLRAHYVGLVRRERARAAGRGGWPAAIPVRFS